MMCITSPAGRKLARTKAELDASEAELKERLLTDEETRKQYSTALFHFLQAAREVTDDLIAQNFHEAEGD